MGNAFQIILLKQYKKTNMLEKVQLLNKSFLDNILEMPINNSKITSLTDTYTFLYPGTFYNI